ncbi:MAG: hypothetical protein WCP12_13565 [bacterium]
MRMMICLMCGIAAIYAAADDSRLHNMLASAATNRGNAYLEARAEILAPGTNALSALGRCTIASDLTWQQRLIARICYERVARLTDIEALRAYNWSADPGYDKKWEKSIVGPGFRMSSLAVSKISEVGLWYYYVELTWKETDETCKSKYTDVRKRWQHWCLKAVSDQPERYWYRLAVEERMAASPFSSWHQGRYETFLRDKEPEAVPILMKYYDAIRNIYSSNRDDWYREGFLQIMAFADSRHADLLEKFMSEKPALESLKNRLAEVRARPAPPPVTEPPFRLGNELVIVK